ncbi:hypothetical protein SAMN05444481_12720 [Flavobacterium frigidimaris]|nr:hypothetical protein SAMN05444481_12720 [Flavobacterium frigidimaris]
MNFNLLFKLFLILFLFLLSLSGYAQDEIHLFQIHRAGYEKEIYLFFLEFF